MINNSSIQKWNRLRVKQLSQLFKNEIETGLNCSPFEAEAVLETVYRIFGIYFETSGTMKPGQILFQVVSENSPPQMKIEECQIISVILTLDAGEDDLAIKERNGVKALRQHRLQRVSIESHQQGGLLTVEDLANRILNCGERTISRDLAELRKKGIVLPLRSTVKDMGRSITHRVMIIKEWLSGKEYSDIAKTTCHSVPSVGNYVDKFKRVIALMQEGYDRQKISFLVRISENLVDEYIKIYKGGKTIDFRRKELLQYFKKTEQCTNQKGSKK
jgi:hypothetical protein